VVYLNYWFYVPIPLLLFQAILPIFRSFIPDMHVVPTVLCRRILIRDFTMQFTSTLFYESLVISRSTSVSVRSYPVRYAMSFISRPHTQKKWRNVGIKRCCPFFLSIVTSFDVMFQDLGDQFQLLSCLLIISVTASYGIFNDYVHIGCITLCM